MLRPLLGGAGETPDAESRAPTDGRAADLDTIVVTAQKHPENAQDVAMAVAVFSDDELLEAAVADAMQLQTVVPSHEMGVKSDLADGRLRLNTALSSTVSRICR